LSAEISSSLEIAFSSAKRRNARALSKPRKAVEPVSNSLRVVLLAQVRIMKPATQIY